MLTSVSDTIVSRCPGWRVESIEELGEGDSCSAYRVNGTWVFRFAKHAEASASLHREFLLLPRIARQFDVQIPSPQLFRADTPPTFIAYPLLPGPDLTQELYQACEESQRQRCAEQIAQFLRQMHTTDLAIARDCGIETTDYSAQHQELLRRAESHLFGKLTEEERGFVERASTGYATLAAGAAIGPVLLHGDFGPGHVLYDPDRAAITAIIDFGDMAIGDPAWDLVYIYEDYGLDLLRRVVPLYADGSTGLLLERMYRLYVLDAIEWTVRCAEKGSPCLEEAVTQVGHLMTSEGQHLTELFSACAR